MGADTFLIKSTGRTAEEAFGAARQQALWESGHGGYTGTIAEKNEFILIGQCPDIKSARLKAQQLLAEDDPRIDDKWGPAGCIKITDTPDTYVFFGWASC